MTSEFPSSKRLWLGASGFYGVRVSDRESLGQRGLLGEGVRRRISATLIDCYLSRSPLALKNTRSSMSTEINKRKPPDRSSPPLWFSRGLAVTFPQDKVVTKVSPTSRPHPPAHLSKANEGGMVVENQEGELCFSNTPPFLRPTSGGVPGKIDRVTTVD